MNKLSITSLVAAGALLAAASVQAAEVKIALDSPPDMEKAGSYVWSHTFPADYPGLF